MEVKLGQLQVQLGDEQVDLDLDALVPVSDDLTREFTEQASSYAYTAMLSARCEALWLSSKREMDETEAGLDRDVRKDLATFGKVTEAMVEAETKLRRAYREAWEYELACREQHLILQAVTRAMEMRGQLLMSLGAHLRAEAQQTGMYVKDAKSTLDDIHGHIERVRGKAPF